MTFLGQRYVYRQPLKRLAAFLFDLIGGILFSPWIRPRTPDASSVRRILIVRPDQLGDIFLTRPAVAALRAHFRSASIDILAPASVSALLQRDKLFDRVLGVNDSWLSPRPSFRRWFPEWFALIGRLARQRYDLAFDFRGDLRSIVLMFAARVPIRAGYGLTGGGFLLNHRRPFPWHEHRVTASFGLLETVGVRVSPSPDSPPFGSAPRRLTGGVVIHPGSGCASKQWPLRRFADLARRILQEYPGEVTVIGTLEERREYPDFPHHPRLRDLRGRTALEALPELIAPAELFVGNDSGPAHIAAACGVPVISIFSGANAAAAWHPWTARLRLISRKTPCSPCESRDCKISGHPCLRDITVDEVLAHIQESLAKPV
jgi:ADP-heptose:LPS heptosyltransferase